MAQKHFLLLFTLFFYSIVSPTESQQASTTAETIISNVTEMTENIAVLILTCKTEKDPQKIKPHVKKLIQIVAALVETIIEKRKSKKLNRSQLSNSVEYEIEKIINCIVEKINETNM